MEHWHALLPGRVYDIGYENLVRRPDEQIRKLIDHLDLEWDPACLSFQGSEGSVGTASNVQVRGAMHTNSIGRWRGYQAMLEPMMKILDAEF